MDSDQKEMQEVLKAMNERVASFSASPDGSKITVIRSSSSLGKKVLMIIIILILVLVGVLLFIKTGGKKPEYKAPKGYQIVYPKNEPPRLEKIK